MSTCLIEVTRGYVLRCGRGRGNLHFDAGSRYRVAIEDAVQLITDKAAKPADNNGDLAELYAYVHAPEPEPEHIEDPSADPILEPAPAPAAEPEGDHEGSPVDEGPDA